MRIEIDPAAGSAYITLGGGVAARAVPVSERLAVDEDDAGRPVGARVTGPGPLPVGELTARYELPGRQRAALEALAVSWPAG